ncbi:mRNA-decapping enzyme subunit 2 [Rhodotorula kratochvilovae]
MAYPPPPPALTAPQSSFASLQLSAVLDDLAARFIVNLPAEELESMDRVCFQIEQAHWYYEDFVRPMASNPSLLPSYSLKAFSLLMFKSCPLLHDLVPQHARIWTSFMQYKERVPVCGAVLINEWWDKVLLVKGWTKGSSWSFPRGKINKEEPEAMCAVREVLEETGFDLTSFFPPAQLHPSYVEPEGQERVPYYVELVIREQKIRLYFVPGVSERTQFETRTRKEISKIEWFALSDLPTWSKEVANGAGASSRKGKGVGVGAGAARSKSELASGRQAKFYMVTPFISHLKLWIDRNKPRNLPPRPAGSLSPYPKHARVPTPEPEDSPLLFGGRALKPWSAEDDATSHLPSEGEHADGEESTEDEYERARDVPPHQRAAWETMQQGTDALQALFFGAEDAAPAAPVPMRPLPVPTQQLASATPTGSSPSGAATATATPPQLAYERQQSFLQPVPKPSNQQSKLLELLGGAPLAPTPPPPQQAQLVGRLDSLSLASPSPLAYVPPAHAPLSPATVAAAQPAPPQPFGALQADQKREKHDALLRALLSVAAKSPPRAPPVPLAPAAAPAPVVEPIGKGSLLSILNGAPPAAPPPVVREDAPPSVKDPLQILREYRARQQGSEPEPPAPAPAPAPPAVHAPSPLPVPVPLPLPLEPSPIAHPATLPSQHAAHFALHHPQSLAPVPVSTFSASPGIAPAVVPHPHPQQGHFPAALHVPYPSASTAQGLPHPHPHPHVLAHPAHMQVLAPFPTQPHPNQQQQLHQQFHPHVPFAHPPPPPMQMQGFPQQAGFPPHQQQQAYAPPLGPPPHHGAVGGGYLPFAPPPLQHYPQQQQQHVSPLVPPAQLHAAQAPQATQAAPGGRGNAGALLGLLNAKG